VPVLGFPVSHDPEGRYVLRLLESIDFPVGRLVLVLNQQEVTDPSWVAEALRVQPRLEVVRPGANLGCAGGWNTVVHTVPDAPYWLICSHDVAFPPGTLRHIAATMADSAEASAASSEAANSSSRVLLTSFAVRPDTQYLPAFTLTREAVAWVGLFDENFWPAYAEDEDYLSRIRIVGRGVHARDSSVVLIHGPQGWDFASSGSYSGTEQYIADRQELAEAKGTFGQLYQATVLHMQLEAADNGKHFCLKFGPVSRPDCKVFEYAEAGAGPFGVLGASWSDWVLDPWRRLCSFSAGNMCGYDRRMMFVDV